MITLTEDTEKRQTRPSRKAFCACMAQTIGLQIRSVSALPIMEKHTANDGNAARTEAASVLPAFSSAAASASAAGFVPVSGACAAFPRKAVKNFSA